MVLQQQARCDSTAGGTAMSSATVQRIRVPEALTHSSTETFQQAIVTAAQSAAFEVIVIVGAPETFCRGLDLDAIASAGSSDFIAEAANAYCRCLTTLRFCNKPTVAVVQGAAAGGGVGIVAACDLVIACDSASFALPEALFGFGPGMVLPVLLERVSLRTARLWALTAFRRSAQEAFREGLVDCLVTESAIDSELNRWCKSLRRAHPRGVGTVKRLCAEVSGIDLATAIDTGRRSTLDALGDPDILRGIARFAADGVLPREVG